MSAEQPKSTASGNAQVLGPQDGEIFGKAGILHDRFMISGKDSGGLYRWRVLLAFCSRGARQLLTEAPLPLLKAANSS